MAWILLAQELGNIERIMVDKKVNWAYAGPGLAMVVLVGLVLYVAVWWVVLDAQKDKRVNPDTAQVILFVWVAAHILGTFFGGMALMDAGGLVSQG
ncbi:hypothetical protein SEA_MARGARET_74 [Gordonia phage Margaret]|nr:hypothetical protein SEA_MARGARET_74 [Gordonia phage Margaret]